MKRLKALAILTVSLFSICPNLFGQSTAVITDTAELRKIERNIGKLCNDGVYNITGYIDKKDITWFETGQGQLKQAKSLIAKVKSSGKSSNAQILNNLDNKLTEFTKITSKDMQVMSKTPPLTFEKFVSRYVFMSTQEWRVFFDISDIKGLSEQYLSYVNNPRDPKETDSRITVVSETGAYPDLKAIYFLDTLNGFIGGDKGTILQTKDGGNTWSRIVSNIKTNVTSIFFQNFNDGFLIADNTLCSTHDGGKNWLKIDVDSTTRCQPTAMSFITSQNGFLASYLSTGQGQYLTKIYETKDGGLTWKQISTIKTYPKFMKFSGSIGYIAGSNSAMGTNNAGQKWEYLGPWNDCRIDFTDNDIGDYLTKQQYDVIPKVDEGHPDCVSFLDREVGYVVGSDNEGKAMVYRTDDGGETWKQIKTGVMGSMRVVHFPSKSYGVAIGDGGVILKVLNGN